jgi:hypothetical protein
MEEKWAEALTTKYLTDAPGTVYSVSIEEMSASELHCCGRLHPAAAGFYRLLNFHA